MTAKNAKVKQLGVRAGREAGLRVGVTEKRRFFRCFFFCCEPPNCAQVGWRQPSASPDYGSNQMGDDHARSVTILSASGYASHLLEDSHSSLLQRGVGSSVMRAYQ